MVMLEIKLNAFRRSTIPQKQFIIITPVFQSGDTWLMTNYRRPIFILPCFSKMLERITYKRLFKCLTENNLLYYKQFRFQKGHSLEHVNQSFRNNEFTLVVCVDLPKAFDAVDHQILLKKLEHCVIARNNRRWIETIWRTNFFWTIILKMLH